MKQTIKLTESKLRNIIKECIKNTLNELDARTYASARDKAFKYGDEERADRFNKAAVDAYNSDYGDNFYDNSDNQYYEYSNKMNYDGTVESVMNQDTGYTYVTQKGHYNPYDDTTKFDTYMDRYNGNNQHSGRSSEIKKTGKKTLKQNPHLRVAKEMSNGSGQYIKGKGWKN